MTADLGGNAFVDDESRRRWQYLNALTSAHQEIAAALTDMSRVADSARDAELRACVTELCALKEQLDKLSERVDAAVEIKLQCQKFKLRAKPAPKAVEP